VEEMVEVYYNSHQFEFTMRALEEDFPDSFHLFEELSSYYESHGLSEVSHNRVSRYAILLDFIREKETGREELYRELLVLDLYMRENLKSRPDFAGEPDLDKDFIREFYEAETEHPTFLRGYEGYQARQLRKMTHMESFSHKVLGNGEPGRQILLFDYRKRDIRTGQAMVCDVTEKF
jgi:hypothetical protein